MASHGRPATDVPGGTPKVPTVNRRTEKVLRNVAKAGVSATATGGGTLFTEPVLVVNQKAKVIEMHNEFAVYDRHGTQIGAVRQVGQSPAKKLVRLLGSVDQFLTHKLQVVDASGAPVMALTRPAKVVRSRITVADASGNLVGDIVQESFVGKIHFRTSRRRARRGIDPRGELAGVELLHHREAGVEVARITKTWEGLGQDAPHDRRQLRRGDHPARGGAPSVARGRRRPGCRHRPEAGRAGLDLSDITDLGF